MRVVNFGSLNIDYVYSINHFAIPGETIAAETMKIYPGGKGLNQSIAIARAGGNVMHVGLYGKEGNFLYDTLLDNGVDVSMLKRVDVLNGHAIIQVDCKGENSILLYSGTNGMINESYIEGICDVLHGDEIVLFQNETSSIEFGMRKAKEKGCKIAFNPAPMDERVFNYPLELVDILIVNEVEGKMLSGQNEVQDIINTLSIEYPNTKIILTLGMDGSWFSYGDIKEHIEAKKTEDVVDTTAAGDTFIGYYLANIGIGLGDVDALNLAAKAASVCVTRSGAAISIPYKEELL